MKHTRKTLNRMAIVLVAFAVAFTSLPMMTGTLDTFAATAKKPAKVTGLSKYAVGTNFTHLKWKKITRNIKGYQIYRYNPKTRKWAYLKTVGKATYRYRFTGLAAGTTYQYRVRAYNTYRQKQYYNTRTRRWQVKRPANRYWRTRKYRYVTRYLYGSFSSTLKIATTKPAPVDKDAVFTKASISGSTSVKDNGNAYDYKVLSSGNVTWSVSDKNIATISSTFSSSKNTNRMATLVFKKAGTVKLSAKSALNGKTKTITINVSGSTPTSSGDDSSTPAQAKRTRVDCTNYLGRAFTIWKDANGNYWDSETGGTQITEPALYSTAIDGTWSSGGHTFVQKGGIAVGGVYFRPEDNGKVLLEVYNGDKSKCKLVVREAIKNYGNYTGDDFNQTFVLDENGNRFAMYYTDPSDSSTIRFDIANSYGFDGFVGGTVHIDGYYDFNGNGALSSDEFVGTRAIDIEPKAVIQEALNIARAATEYYGTSSYMADMEAINAYIFKNYKQTDKYDGTNTYIGNCIGGANIQKAWSISKWNVLGSVYTAPGFALHEAFYPVEGNPYTTNAYFEADGHNYTQGQVPGSDSYNRELERREAQVREYMAAGK